MKILVVKSLTESRWGSCKVISPNLSQLYSKLEPEFSIDWFELPQDLLKWEVLASDFIIAKFCSHVEQTNPDRIVFVDHLPQPALVLTYLSMLLNFKKLPPIIFHVYGDFSYFAKEWILLNDNLIGLPVRFIVASDSQKRLLENFLFNAQSEDVGIDKLCFPVNSKEYYFNKEERESYRLELGLNDSDIVILYSGRISLQKNVDILINEFLKIKKENKRFHLWIAGAFDDVGADFMGYESYHGYMFSKIHSLLSQASLEDQSRIKFLGHQRKAALRKIKSAADIFASFSLYHDEDYGMSPAEALATGLSTILTDWGGYSSFASQDKWDCQLIPVSLSQYGFELNLQPFHDKIDRYVKERDCLNKREQRSRDFLKEFSINQNVANLAHILKKKPIHFSGFNWLLDQYAVALSENWSKNKFNKFLSPGSDGYYYGIYKNYISGLNRENSK